MGRGYAFHSKKDEERKNIEVGQRGRRKMKAPSMPKMKTIACVRPNLNAPATKKIKLPKLSVEEKRIGEMLLENTGTHFLDSGSAYGRNWERNQRAGLVGLLKAPEVEIHGEADGSFWFSKSLMHTLPKLISITKDSEKLQKEFDKLSKSKPDESDFELMDEFATSKMTPDNEMSTPLIENTYNDSDTYNLSQDLQFAIFPKNGKRFVALQIHGGCDARGGYTSPKLFEISDMSEFISGLQVEVYDPNSEESASGRDIFYTAKEEGWKFKNGKIVNAKGKELLVN